MTDAAEMPGKDEVTSAASKKRRDAMNIFYEIGNSLYVNLTNRCSCDCTFCLRNVADGAHGSDTLWLAHEPTYAEAVEALDGLDLDAYDEVVFCGYGEPTCALDVLLALAAEIKRRSGVRVRINTNGQGSLIAGRDICPDLEGIVDAVSISLNTPDAKRYLALTRSRFGEDAHPAMLIFARDVRRYVPDVVMTTVATTLSAEEEERCQRICDDLGVGYRIRSWVES